MNYDVQIRRAQLLIQQRRLEQAEQELRGAIAHQPAQYPAYALLALVLSDKEDNQTAQQLAEQAVSLEPQAPLSHYVLSVVLMRRHQLREAEAAIQRALEFDPTSPDYHAQAAAIRIAQKRWHHAVEAAERGLHFDPQHATCTNLRAMALTKLGRRDEAGMTIRTALAHDPEDPVAHANMGWTLLHDGQHRQACEHFREALRLDPDNDWARDGVVEALKARNVLYRWVLRYMLWISTFSHRTQLLLFIGIMVVIQMLARLPETGLLRNLGMLLALAYMLFVMTIWIASPLFNLILRCDRFGRMALTDEQRADSNWMAAALLAVAILVAGPVVTGFRVFDVVNYLLLLVAVGVTLNVPRQANRQLAAIVTLAVFSAAGWYWFRWYVYSGLPFTVCDVRSVEAYLAGNPETADAVRQQLSDFLHRQRLLSNLSIWPIVGMTWFSGALRRQVR